MEQNHKCESPLTDISSMILMRHSRALHVCPMGIQLSEQVTNLIHDDDTEHFFTR